MSRLPGLAARGFPEEGTIFDVSGLDLRVAEGEHPFVRDHGPAISRHWQTEVAANPSLYDGGILFQHRLDHEDGRITGLAHMVPFSTLLYWRRHGRPEGATHLFAMPLLVGADGGIVAIRMSRTTANPGAVYCAAGSLDAHDIVGGRIDVEANMAREVAEETGLDLGMAQSGTRYKALHLDNTVVLVRVFSFNDDAETLARRIEAHVAGEAEPEIDAPVIIRDANPDRHPYAFFMPPILGWHFGR